MNDLHDLSITLPPKTAECTFFSMKHETFNQIDYILVSKVSLQKFSDLKSHVIFPLITVKLGYISITKR